MGRASVPLLVLAVASMAYSAMARSDPAPGIMKRRQLQATFPNALTFVRSRPDLTVYEALLAHFPYLVLAALNPAVEGTVFLPTDAAWQKYLKVNTTLDVIKTVFNDLEPILNVSPGVRESSTKRVYWAALTNHVVVGKAFTAEELVTTTDVETALPGSGGLSGMMMQGKVVVYGDQSHATVVTADIKAGNAILHVVDTVLSADVAPPDDFPLISTTGADNAMFMQILAKSSLYPALNSAPPTNGPYTVFTPTDAAVTKYLAAQKTTLAKLLANPKACTAIAQAHVIQGTALWLWDLMTVGALAPKAGSGPAFLNGKPLVIASTLSQAYIKAGKVTTEVTAPVDLGGNTFGCTTKLVDGECNGDYTSVFHIIDAVLPSA